MSVPPPKLVVLLTDFGHRDGYVAAMKGRIYAECGDAVVVDASHNIEPHNVAQAAWVLGQYWKWFPAGTLHVAVVDPGVGSDRRIIMLRADGQVFLAPDNGLLTWVVQRAKHWESRTLNTDFDQPVCATFHGRDLFAVAAGRLAAGKAVVEEISDACEDLILLPFYQVEDEGDTLRGRIVHVDNFGNLVTNIPGEMIMRRGSRLVVSCKGREITSLRRTYSDAKPGELLALIGSNNTLEIAAREKRAAELLDAGYGDEVIVRFLT